MKHGLVILILLSSHASLAAGPQDIGAGLGEYVKVFPNQTLSGYDIGLAATASGSVAWSYCTAPSCSTFTAAAIGTAISLSGGMIITFSGGTSPFARITGTLIEGKYYLALRIQYSSGPGVVTELRRYVFVVRKPIDHVFVLDRSGSMECDASENTESNWPACRTNAPHGTRWGMLKASIINFVSKLSDQHNMPEDRFGVVYFSGQVTPGSAVSPTLVNQTAFVSGITTDMNSVPIQNSSDPMLARDGTSIGNGLFTANQSSYISSIPTGVRRIILLFTDGEQNTGRWVHSGGRHILPNSAASPSGSILNLDTDPNLEVFTVGKLSAGSGPALLQSIADQPSNYFQPTFADEAGFASAIGTAAFNAIYSGYSPQCIGSVKQNLRNTPVKFSVVCNKNVNRVFMEAYFDSPIAKAFKYTIEKDGVPITAQSTKRVVSDYIVNYIFDFNTIKDLTSEGTWTMNIMDSTQSARPTGSVTFFATADDPHVKLAAGLKEPRVLAGQKIYPVATLTVDGKPITDAVVKAVIRRPGDDIGDLLARTQVPSLPKPTSESGTIAGQKFGYLAANQPAALSNLRKIRETTVTLNHQGNGVYTGEFGNVDVTGVYKILYTVKSALEEFGNIERIYEETINVGFASVRLNPLGKPQVKNPPEITKTVTVKPCFTMYGKERFVGPGFEYSFGVFDSDIKLRRVVDNGDGSYDLSFSGKEESKLQLNLLDEVIYRGTLRDIDKARSR